MHEILIFTCFFFLLIQRKIQLLLVGKTNKTKINSGQTNEKISTRFVKLPQNFSLDEVSPLGVRGRCVAICQRWVDGILKILLHLKPAWSTWREFELLGHRVLSVRVIVSVIIVDERLGVTLHAFNLLHMPDTITIKPMFVVKSKKCHSWHDFMWQHINSIWLNRAMNARINGYNIKTYLECYESLMLTFLAWSVLPACRKNASLVPLKQCGLTVEEKQSSS